MDSLLENPLEASSPYSCVTQKDLTYIKFYSTSSPAMKWTLYHYMPAVASTLDYRDIANNH